MSDDTSPGLPSRDYVNSLLAEYPEGADRRNAEQLLNAAIDIVRKHPDRLNMKIAASALAEMGDAFAMEAEDGAVFVDVGERLVPRRVVPRARAEPPRKFVEPPRPADVAHQPHDQAGDDAAARDLVAVRPREHGDRSDEPERDLDGDADEHAGGTLPRTRDDPSVTPPPAPS